VSKSFFKHYEALSDKTYPLEINIPSIPDWSSAANTLLLSPAAPLFGYIQ